MLFGIFLSGKLSLISPSHLVKLTASATVEIIFAKPYKKIKDKLIKDFWQNQAFNIYERF